jgi:hypothetical protein
MTIRIFPLRKFDARFAVKGKNVGGGNQSPK